MSMYFKSFTSSDGSVYSIDMLTITGKFFGKFDDVSLRFWSYVRGMLICDYDEWSSFKIGSYRWQYSVDCDNGFSYWLGLGFNSAKQAFFETSGYWCLRFNPTRVFFEYRFLKVYSTLLQLSRYIQIKRFDLAIDFLCHRSSCSLLKDKRTYTEYSNSLEDRTQSLGHHNSHGHVKLYSKQIESRLSVPLTRCELSVDYKQRLYSDVCKIFPVVWIVNDFQMKLDNLTLSDTDFFILLMCLEDVRRLSMLSYRKRNKIKSYLDKYTSVLKFDELTYKRILSLLVKFSDIEYIFYEMKMSKNVEQLSLTDFYSDADIQTFSDEEIELFFQKNSV